MYEYVTISLYQFDWLNKLNKLGKQGWHLVLETQKHELLMEREIDPENDAILDPVEIGIEDAPIDYSDELTASGVQIHVYGEPEPRQIGTGPYTI